MSVSSTGATTWGIGDYPAMARRLMPAAVAAVNAARIQAGQHVVDVATGSGNAAILAALAGGTVTGVDFEPALLALAERHAVEAGVKVDWRSGNAERLPLLDACADVVLSVFGVMYAIDHDAAAAELARVAAPGGRVVLTAWAPGSLMPTMGRVLGPYLPPPPASPPPTRWGDTAAVTELLASVGLTVKTAETRHIRMDFSGPEAATALLIDSAGHVLAERERLRAAGLWETLRADVRTFVVEHGTAGPSDFALTADYLVVSADAV
jgi:SAM-dependent methyltransferase